MANLKDLIVRGASRFFGKVSASSFSGDGAEITNLNAGNIATGTLPVARGGTGKTTGTDAANYFMNSLTTGTADPVDADYYISQSAGGGSTTTTYHRRPISALWNYIKSKIVATYAGKAAASGGTDNCLVTTGQKYTWNSKTSNTGTVTSVQIQATSPVQSSTSTPQSTTLNTTISLADGYGDTKNPYASKTAKYVLAAPTNAAGAPTFRQLSSSDISGLGTAANYTASISVENNNNLPTGAAIQSYVTGLGYQANQNAFSNVAVGSSTIQADSVTDTLTIAGSGATSVTADTTNDKITISSTDTKNTAGSTDTSSKIFLIGATTQAANPTTNSQDTAYVGTDGHLYSNSKQVVNLSDSQALTNKTYNGYTLAAACAKGVDTSMTTSSTSTNLPTTAAVASAISSAIAASDAMIFKGTLGTGGTITTLPTTYKTGWTYRVVTAGTYAGNTCEPGDLIIALVDRSGSGNLDADWTIAQTNIDGAITTAGGTINGTLIIDNELNADAINAGSLVVTGDATFSNDLRGNLIGTVGGFTVGKSVPSDAVFTDTKVTSSANHYSPSTVSGQDKTASASGGTAAWSMDVVKGVTLNTDGKGHVTGLSVTSGKIPANPNTNTTYSLTQDSTDGHKITLTPSSGTAQTVTIPDNNTTYTFANGTNGFTVTPSGGTAQTVTVTPSITNNVTGSGTSGYIAKFNGANTITSGPQLGSGTTTYLRNDGTWATPSNTTYSAGTGLSLDGTVFSNDGVLSIKGANQDEGLTHYGNVTLSSSQIGAVSYIDSQSLTATQKTTVKTNLGLGTVVTQNYTGTISGGSSGDIPTVDAVTNYVTNLGYENQNAFSKIVTNTTGSTAIQADSPTDTLTVVGGGATTVTTDATNDKITISSTDTKNTAGSTNTSSKIYLIGATSQAANPQTYSDDQVYVTDGTLQAAYLNATSGIRANTANSSSVGGVALYSTNPDSYGIIMRGTGTATGQYGKHGYAQGDWATYFTMSGSTNRGYIFHHGGNNVASISGEGKAVFNSSVTVGGNEGNTSGCRMEYNATTQCLEFVFP